MNSYILGAGKIGLDLFIKCKKLNLFDKIVVVNKKHNSIGAKYCKKNKITIWSGGLKKNINKINDKNCVIFDATSASSSYVNFKLFKKNKKKIFYFNLTPSNIGKFTIPYYFKDLKNNDFNLITCGGQSSIPLILEIKKKIKDLKYVELISSISSSSAGKATRDNIDDYINNTEKAIKELAKINKAKVIINLNPSVPPVNMMNSIFFETSNNIDSKKIKLIKQSIQTVNKKIKKYIPGYNAKFFKTKNENVFRVTVRVIGIGDYLPSYAGNLDIITSAATYLSKLIYEKNYN